MKTTFNKNPVAPKHTPRRTCVACRQVKPKRQLVRLVRTPDGNIELDETGKRNGRGAYVCHSSECWEKALAGTHLERTLQLALSPANREKLITNMKTIFKGDN